MEKEKRYYWLDILKIIACFCVIVNHSGGYLLDYTGNAKIPTLFYCIQFCLCKIGVPVFIMTTGYLLLRRDKDIKYKEVFKRIFRIIIPLIGISLLLFIKENGIKNFSLIAFIQNFLSKPFIAPFWYLYMLIGLYLVMPFIKKMVNNLRYEEYKIFIILFLILPSILSMVSYYLNINFSSYFLSTFFPMIIAYFISGVYLSEKNISKKNLIISILLFSIASILSFLSFYYPYILKGSVSYRFDSYTSFYCAIQSLSLFYIIRYLFEKIKFNKVITTIIEEVSKSTFGIYLLHYLIIYKIYNLGIMQNIFGINPYLGILFLELLVFVICGIVTFILRQIPIIKKFL